jgi:diguanylate cyclase (GGDEF)-like protein/PAS domain S-box-containing protein
MEQSVEAIYLYDAKTKQVLESNKAFCKMMGYSEEELLGLHIYDFIDHAPEDIDRNVERSLREGRRHVIEERRFVGERRYRRKDGKSLEVEVSANLIPYHDGKAVCVVIRDVTERKALEEQLRHQAFHDPLTDPPNRALLLDRLEHALARSGRLGKPVAMLFVDLDDFKVVNDSLGHDAGNIVLVEVAERLRACVRPGDTVARIFGDEFAVLLEAPASVEDAHRVTERIQDRLQAPFDVKGREVFVSSSVGIATGDPARDRPDDLLRHADLAMFEAKSCGKGRYEVFVPSMSTRATERLDLERDLRRAVERDEFEVHYQPIIDLRTGEIVAFEALARWRHPERGLLAAADFIRLAEETGLIRSIGRLVLEEACRQAKEWGERHADGTPAMSVNLSASQFAHQPDMIPEVLTGTGLDPQRLQLEITERTVMHNAEFAPGQAPGAQRIGCQLRHRRLREGYSCLYYPKNMPVDSLKIDRAFITGLGQNPEDTAIVSGTISLGHALGLQVVAEGVESAEQLAALRKLGCDLAQGYHFAKPLPREAAERLLAQDTTW